MIRRLLSGILIILFSFMSQPAMAYDPLIQLILEKRVIGNLKGSHAIINSASIRSQGFGPAYEAPLSLSNVVYQQYPFHLLKEKNAKGEEYDFYSEMSLPDAPSRLKKHYQIVKDAEHFQSLISVRNEKGQELSRISVGRRAVRLLPHPHLNRVYVLCGGYFGSVWEIDTSRDVVLRKLPVWHKYGQKIDNFDKSAKLWNPQELTLDSERELLWVLSGQGWQSIDMRTGVLSPKPVSEDSANHPHPLGYDNPSLTASVVTPIYEDFDYDNLSFVASRNADFIHILDKQLGKPVGIIPVDFPVNDLLISDDRKRMFAYHAEFGQISVIDLEPFSRKRLSVVSRVRHPNFVSPTARSLMLAQNDEDIYLWDGFHKAIGAINVWTLVPRFNLPFRVGLFKQAEKVLVSKIARKRFYLKKGELYIEDYGSEGRKTPSRARNVDMGRDLSAIALSDDQRKLYILDALQNRLIVMDAFDNHPEFTIKVGKNPRNLVVSSDRIYVLNADESSISAVDITEKRVSTTLLLNTERFQPYIVTIFDPGLTQLIHVEVPRYLQNAELMVG